MSSSAGSGPAGAATTQEPTSPVSDVPAPVPVVTPEEQGAPHDLQVLAEPFTGDLDGMVERRMVRLLTVFSRGFYFLDGPNQRGVTYEAAQQFETARTGNLKIYVIIIIPVTRDQLLPALAAGYGDIAAANLTITPERQTLVDFSDAGMSNVDEIVVTGPTAPPLDSIDDLSGKQVHVRRSSSYYESLVTLNERFDAAGRVAVEIIEAPEYLEDDDILEMVNAGLVPMAIVDSHKAAFWAQIFDDIEPRTDLAIRTDGEIAWAIRKDSPQLMAVDQRVHGDESRGHADGEHPVEPLSARHQVGGETHISMRISAGSMRRSISFGDTATSTASTG